jgi:hypothetical protein
VGSAAIVFYTDRTLWNAQNSTGASDDFSQANWAGGVASPYISSTSAAISSPYSGVLVDMNTSNGTNNVTPTGSGTDPVYNGPTQSWDQDLGAGRYLNAGPSGMYVSYRLWGSESQAYNAETGQWEQTSLTSNQQYSGDRTVHELDLTVPTGYSSVAFDAGLAASENSRPITVTVNTFLGETRIVQLDNVYGSLSFFGFQAPTGDTITSIRISALFVPFTTPTYSSWNYSDADHRGRTWNTGSLQAWQDTYKLALDNLWLGSATGGTPPDGGGGNPGSGGDVPEPAAILLVGSGLLLISRLKKPRLAR